MRVTCRAMRTLLPVLIVASMTLACSGSPSAGSSKAPAAPAIGPATNASAAADARPPEKIAPDVTAEGGDNDKKVAEERLQLEQQLEREKRDKSESSDFKRKELVEKGTKENPRRGCAPSDPL